LTQQDQSNKVARDEAKGDDSKLHEPTIADSKSDDETWETVPHRPRNTRKKASNHGRHGPHHHGNHGGHAKKKPRTKEQRQRTKNRKIVREILSSVLDSVDEVVRRRRSLSRESSRVRGAHSAPTAQKKLSAAGAAANSNPVATSHKSNAVQKKGSTMRDILVGAKGGKTSQATQNTATAKAAPASFSERGRAKTENISGYANPPRTRNEPRKHDKSEKVNLSKTAGSSPADQNTVPTVPETLSAVSTSSAYTPSIRNVVPHGRKKASCSDSSSGDSAEALKPQNPQTRSSKESSPSPPLPTLLNPGNNNSSSSSVASSLDAPHAGHHANLSHQSEDDVGYHLLDVCDRLSRDISVFMKRREDALAIRRQERGLVLSALEDTLGAIWPGMCSVEMYGSCATNLDLPSSDLDIVIRGLDRPVEIVSGPSTSVSARPSTRGDTQTTDRSIDRDDRLGRVNSHPEISQYVVDKQFSQHKVPMYMAYGHMSLNAQRVITLATELEHRSWAVHVKAIPTATVPVIKILADPARLPGSVSRTGDWLVQHSMTQQTPGAEGSESRASNQAQLTHYPNGQGPPLWRGADVVNGLFQVDITFEGPEHGGIGSTQFSSHAVQKWSEETGLEPEATPAVQVLMVLKELLAQRRLNEPFSGGLSSYALLLLVISVVRERSIIREELEKAERQRRVVAAGGGNSALRSLKTDPSPTDTVDDKNQKRRKDPPKPEDIRPKNMTRATTAEKTYQKQNEKLQEPVNSADAKTKPGKNQSKSSEVENTTVPNAAPKGASQSSWASIARKSSSSGSLQQKVNDEDPPPENLEQKLNSDTPVQRKVLNKPSSFADAVAKGAPTAAKTPAVSQHAPSKDQEKLVRSKKNEGKNDISGKRDVADSQPQDSSRENHVETTVGINGPPKAQSKPKPSAVTDQGTGQGSVSSSNPNRLSAWSNAGDSGLDSSLFPQGFHDVVEVLCSGETTPGKLLMHVLLFYGQHFDSQSTAIDYSGTHDRDPNNNLGYSVRSPYFLRRSAGTFDPVTGMLTVDQIVVYDPLEGAETKNVAKSCFLWSNIRWVFAQSYMTLSSAVEMNASSQGGGNRATHVSSDGPAYGHDESGNVIVDPSSPLLELLLSF
jgi:hypothetical protein